MQVSLRRLIARTYFENIDNLQFNESVAALLVWTSMPVSTSIGRDLAPVAFNTDRELLLGLRDARHTFCGGAGIHIRLRRSRRRWKTPRRGCARPDKPNADLFRPARASQFVQHGPRTRWATTTCSTS